MVFCALILVAVGLVDEAELDVNRSLAEYRLALARLQSHVPDPIRVEGERTIEVVRKGATIKNTNIDVRILISGGISKAIYLNSDGFQGICIIDKVKNEYLSIQKDSASAGYTIREVGAIEGADPRLLETGLKPLLRSRYMLYDLDLPKMLYDPAFRARKATKLRRDGRELIRFGFDYAIRPTGSKEPTRYSGWFVVDPKLGWGVSEYEMKASVGSDYSIYRGSVSYVASKESMPLPKRVVSEYASPDGFRDTHVYSFTKFAYEPTPPREFTLDYYGLADFRSPVRPRSNQLSFVLFGIGAAALGLGAVFRSRSRRDRAA